MISDRSPCESPDRAFTGNVRHLNAPAFGPYLKLCLFFETVAWFREISMSHTLSHRLPSMPAVNTSTSASLVHIYPTFSVLWCFLAARLHQCKLKPVCRLFSAAVSIQICADDNSWIDSREKCFVAGKKMLRERKTPLLPPYKVHSLESMVEKG